MRNPGIIMHASRLNPLSQETGQLGQATAINAQICPHWIVPREPPQPRLVAVELALRLLRHTLCTILRRSTQDLCVFVESSLALCVLVASNERLLAVNTAGSVGVLACCSSVGRVGFAVAHEVVDEGVCVLAGALSGFLLAVSLVVDGGGVFAYAALVQGTLQLVCCVFS
jgi:hypothetical protein